MKTDKFLIGIVIGAAVLVIAASAIVLGRPEPTYLPDTAPENIVQNYILAVQQEDYSRAYSYLSPEVKSYPIDVTDFKRDLERFTAYQNQVESLAVEDVSLLGDTATVFISAQVYYQGGLFDSGQYSNTYRYELDRLSGEWKLSSGDAFFAYCWNADIGCE
ncbi:MAG: hypothetical protein EPO32_14135 [Anaerolineae bacterium]|nr:MAG: hypothetical protein EPO32_14135 [Anaerolineae bacterium]